MDKLQRYSLDANTGKMAADSAGDYFLADEVEDRVERVIDGYYTNPELDLDVALQRLLNGDEG